MSQDITLKSIVIKLRSRESFQDPNVTLFIQEGYDGAAETTRAQIQESIDAVESLPGVMRRLREVVDEYEAKAVKESE